MRKNYFAKKFVAYTMAFAVAFSTVTVSPLFVKEAKAAKIVGPAGASLTADHVLNSTNLVLSGAGIHDQFIIGSNVTSTLGEKSDMTVSKDEIIKRISGANDDNATVLGVKSKEATTSDGTTNYSYEKLEFLTNTTGPVYGVSAAPVLVDFGTTGTFTTTQATTGKWYKLKSIGDSFEVKTGNTAAPVDTVSYSAYEIDPVTGENSTGNLSFNKNSMGKSQYGLYLGVNSDSTYVLVNLIEYTGLKAASERPDGFTVQAGNDANLVVHASNDGSREITYKWRFGQTTLSSTTNECKVEKVDGNKTGTYYCTVSDGAAEAVIKINLSTATAVVNKPEYTTVVDALASNGRLNGGNVSLTSSVPANDNYRYIWADTTTLNATASKISLSEKAGLNYDAVNNSIVVTDKTNSYSAKRLQCFTLTKEDYEKIETTEVKATTPSTVYYTIGELLKKVEEAQTDVTKDSLKDAIRNAEVSEIHVADVTGAVTTDFTTLYTETFKLVDEDMAKTTKSVNLVKSIGDSVEMTAPEFKSALRLPTTNVPTGKTAGTFVSYQLDTDNTVGKTAKITNVASEDFGTHTYVVNETYNELTVPDGSKTTTTDTDVNGGTHKFVKIVNGAPVDINDMGASTVTAYETANNVTVYKMKVATTTAATSTIYYNIIYKSDLKAEAVASNVKARVGEKNVELGVNASSAAGVKYTWYKHTANSTTTTVQAQSTKSTYKIETVASDDIYVPEVKDELGKVDTPEYNYYTCEVTNGIEKITLKFTLGQEGGYKVYADKEAAGTGTSVVIPLNAGGKTSDTVNVDVILGKELVLQPYVVAPEGAKITYKWYEISDTKTILSETDTLKVNLKEDTSYVCIISDGTDDFKLTYTTTDATAAINKSNVTLVVDKVEAQTYTGKAITPDLDVRIDTTPNAVGGVLASKLVEGTDYTVEYKENVNAGVARATVTPAGLYKGEAVEVTFFIDRADNEVVLANTTSATPKVTKNLAKAPLTYTYFSDAEGKNEIEAPTKAGVYYVQANAIATANYNAAVSNIAKVVIAPAVAKNFKLAARGTNSIKASWAKVAGAKGYRVYQKVNGSWVRKADIHATSYTFTGLKAGTTYNFAVKPYLKDGNTPVWAKTYTGLTAFTKPAKVAGFKVASKTRTSVKTTWSKTTGATMYRVYKVVNGKWVKVKDVTGTSYTFTGLKKNTSYKFAVKAFKSGVAADSYPTLTTRTTK